MGKMKNAGENSRKAAGQAKKQSAKANKAAEAEAQQAAIEDELWAEGANTKMSKKEMEAAKREEAKRKKAERNAELEKEMAEASKKKPQQSQKKAGSLGGGIDNALRGSDLEAHNIEDAISALEIATGTKVDKIERHPERRFKPALADFEESNMDAIRKENPGLRMNQYKQLAFEAFKKSPKNPFNQPHLRFNASKDEELKALQLIMKLKEDKLKRKDSANASNL